MFPWNEEKIVTECYSEETIKRVLQAPEGRQTYEVVQAICIGMLMIMDHIEKQEQSQEPYKCVSCCAPNPTLSPGMICDNCLREQYKNNPPEDQL